MHLNYYFLKKLTYQLAQKIRGFKLVECYSQNKNELIFGFTNGSNDFFIKAIFNGSFSLLSFPNNPKRARKNSIDLFVPIINQSIIGLFTFKNERSFCMEFNNKHSLVFKLHGNRSNIILFNNENNISQFKNSLIADKSIKINQLHREIDQSDIALKNSNFDLQIVYPTFGKKIINHLNLNDFKEQNETKKIELLDELIKELESPISYVYDQNGIPYLSLFKEEKTTIFSSENPIEAYNYFATNYIAGYYLQKEKKIKTSALQKAIIKSNNYIKKSKIKLTQLETGIKYEEIANILMANLHVESKNKTIELFDFYRNNDITIKLNISLSLQKNAENYYRKSKHQQLEKDKLNENIASKEKELKKAKIELELIEEISDLKSLRAQNKLNPQTFSKNIKQSSSPYNELIIDGFRVLIGKSAKNNDQLISKHASKNDLWLHARGVSGSHIIIKEHNNIPFPKALIEKIASLAAWHSKGKNDSLCPVIYTPHKFIRKPKGALPGQVIVEKEEVILVKPCRNVQ